VDFAREIDDILTIHHEPAKAAMASLTPKLADTSLAPLWNEVAGLLTQHLWKEEQILFPAILSGNGPCGGGLMGPIRQMQYEHGLLHDLEARLSARVAEAGPAEAELRAFLADLDVHARREDEQLFPAVMAAS